MKKQKLSPALTLALLLLLSAFASCNKDRIKEKLGQEPLNIKLSALGAPVAMAFIHPGILNTKSSLDTIASQVNANNQTRLDAYQNLLNYCNQHVPSNNYKANVGVAGGATTLDETSFKGDALLAYALALRWAKTGSARYAVTAKQIIDGWANAFETIYVQSGSEARQPALEAAWAAPTFAAAAEILKHYIPVNGKSAEWSTSENSQLIIFLNRLKNQYINNIPGYRINNNWTVSAGYAKMAIGVFEDDQTEYQEGLNIIKKILPILIEPDGSMPREICGGGHNDCVHFQYALTGLTYAANIAAIQGDFSVYDASSSRLRMGYLYQYKFFKNILPNPPSCVSCSIGSKIWPGIEMANGLYNTRQTNFLHVQYNPDADGLPGGDISFLSWTNYTHNGVSP